MHGVTGNEGSHLKKTMVKMVRTRPTMDNTAPMVVRISAASSLSGELGAFVFCMGWYMVTFTYRAVC